MPQSIGTLIVDIRAKTDALGADLKAAQQKFDALNQSVTSVSAPLNRMGQEGAKAADSLGRSFNEVHLQAQGLEQILGVHMPRAITHMVSEIGAIGPAIEVAFATVAVVAMFEAVRKLPDLFDKLADSVMGWDEAAKKAYDNQIKLNQQYIDVVNKATEADIRRRESAGMITAVQSTQELIALKTRELAEQEKIRNAAEKTLDAMDLSKTDILGQFDLAEQLLMHIFAPERPDVLKKRFEEASQAAQKLNVQLQELRQIEQREAEKKDAANWFADATARAKEFQDQVKKLQEEAKQRAKVLHDAIVSNNNAMLAAAQEEQQQESRNIGLMTTEFLKGLNARLEGYNDYLKHLEVNETNALEIIKRNEAELLKSQDEIQRQMSAAIAPNTDAFLKATDMAIEDANDALRQIDQRARDVVDGISDGIGRMFEDSIAHGKTFWEAFKNLGTDALGSIASYFIKTSLKQILTSSTSAIGQMVSQVQSAFGGMGGLIVAGAMGLGSMIGSIGAGRREADRFVQTQQNPFAQNVENLFQALSKAKEMGTLTVAEVSRARDNLDKMWSEFQSAAAQATHNVGEQAITGLSPLVSQWQDWLNGLEAAATPASEAVDAVNAQLEELAQQTYQTFTDIITKILQPAGFLDPLEAALRDQFSTMNFRQLFGAVGDDIQRIGDTMREAQRPMPPYIAALYDVAQAQKRLLDINNELGDTVRDAAYWQTQYDDAVKASADKLQSLTEQRKSLEKQIRDAEFNLEKSRLENVIATTSNIKTYYAAQKDLAALNARIQDQSVTDQMQAIIDMDIQLAQVIEDQQAAADAYAHASAAAQDAIYAEKERIALLESERQRLMDFTAAADLANASFQHVIDILAQFGLLSPEGFGALPHYQSGTNFVPDTQLAILHRGEAVVPASQNQGAPYGGGMTVNLHVYGSVVTDKQLVQHVQTETLRFIQQYGMRPQTRQTGTRSNRY